VNIKSKICTCNTDITSHPCHIQTDWHYTSDIAPVTYMSLLTLSHTPVHSRAGEGTCRRVQSGTCQPLFSFSCEHYWTVPAGSGRGILAHSLYLRSVAKSQMINTIW